MKKYFSYLLVITYIAFLTACGGGMSEQALTGTKWSLDVDALEKEAKRIINKIGDEDLKKQADEGLKQLGTFKSVIESLHIEFKEDGTMGAGGLEALGLGGAASEASKVKWALSGNTLTLDGEGEKLNLKISGSSSNMALTLTQAEMKALAKKSGEEIPADAQKELDAVGDITISFKAAKE